MNVLAAIPKLHLTDKNKCVPVTCLLLAVAYTDLAKTSPVACSKVMFPQPGHKLVHHPERALIGCARLSALKGGRWEKKTVGRLDFV